MTTETVSARRLQTQERLMDAAVVLFAHKGVLAATVEEICEQAGFTRGAFYSNFASKDDLCVAVLHRQAHQKLRMTEAATVPLPAGAPASDLNRLIEDAVTVFLAGLPSDRDSLIADSELRLYAVRSPAIREAFLELSSEMTLLVGDVLTAALDRLGARLVLPIDQAVELLYAVYEHSGTTALIHGGDPDDAGRAGQLAALLRSLVVPR